VDFAGQERVMPGESELFSRFGREVSAGTVVFREGEEGDQMFVIQAGKVKVSRSLGGKQQILAILGKGDFFGEMAIVNRVRRTATVTALEVVKLLAFDREGFLNMINKNPRIALNVIDKLCRRLQSANLYIQHLARKDPKGLIGLNLSYAFQAALGGSEGPGVPPSLAYDRTVEDFSQNLELSMEEVKRALEELARDGIVEISANTILLRDARKLDALSE
jgi:CRP/FNR family cyclic AMP-dependent transcriptional regulator